MILAEKLSYFGLELRLVFACWWVGQITKGKIKNRTIIA
jgi:hypothetical protein